MKKCIKCGYQNEDSAIFCEKCGTRLEQSMAPLESEKKSKPKLIWLWIILLVIAIAGIVGLIVFFMKDDKGSKNTEDDIVIEAEPEVEPEDDPVIVDTLPEIIINTPTPSPVTETPTPVPEITTPEYQEDIIVDTIPENVSSDIAPESKDIEERIQDIRDIYYGIQNNLETYTSEENNGLIGYRDSNGDIVKISAKKGTLDEIAAGDIYSSEYYYEIINNDCYMRFVFVFGNGEEYRIYFDRTGACIRFIGPDGIIYDNEDAANQLSLRSDLTSFSTLGRAGLISILEDE